MRLSNPTPGDAGSGELLASVPKLDLDAQRLSHPLMAFIESASGKN